MNSSRIRDTVLDVDGVDQVEEREAAWSYWSLFYVRRFRSKSGFRQLKKRWFGSDHPWERAFASATLGNRSPTHTDQSEEANRLRPALSTGLRRERLLGNYLEIVWRAMISFSAYSHRNAINLTDYWATKNSLKERFRNCAAFIAATIQH